MAQVSIHRSRSIDTKKMYNIAATLGIIIIILLSGYSVLKYYDLIASGAFFESYQVGHQYKDTAYKHNLKQIYEIEYSDSDVNLKKLKINHQKMYLNYDGEL